MPESESRQKVYVSVGFSDLTFALRTRSSGVANVKSTPRTFAFPAGCCFPDIYFSSGIYFLCAARRGPQHCAGWKSLAGFV